MIRTLVIGVVLIAVLVVLFTLAGCAFTDFDVTYANPDGSQVTASYTSTKDIAAPTFVFERDPETGRVTRVVVGAESSLASPVIDAQGNALEKLGAAVGAGVGAAVRQGVTSGLAPSSFDRGAEERRIEQMIWDVNSKSL